MDKKMRSQIGKPLKKAVGLVQRAKTATTKLANYDEHVRDPIIAKYKKMQGKCQSK